MTVKDIIQAVKDAEQRAEQIERDRVTRVTLLKSVAAAVASRFSFSARLEQSYTESMDTWTPVDVNTTVDFGKYRITTASGGIVLLTCADVEALAEALNRG